MRKNFISLGLIGFNIIFLLYYSFQLLIFTDEFALKNATGEDFNSALKTLLAILGDLRTRPVVVGELGVDTGAGPERGKGSFAFATRRAGISTIEVRTAMSAIGKLQQRRGFTHVLSS